MERIECVVIGAGVVGLAVARRLAQEGREVVLLEAEDRIGTGVSSRNSEVIHAGIYYAAGSRKAESCVAGRRALYAYCQARGVAHRRCGKLIVATAPEEIGALRQVQSRARANGVELDWLEADEAMRMEPQLRCAAALHSPETGIVDSHGLMKALLQDAEDGGALLALLSPVRGGRSVAAGIELEVGGLEPTRILASRVYNCAALGAQQVARSLAGLRQESIPALHLSKGNYFALAGRSPFSQLVYPVPSSDWLGIHLTLDLAGQARFGPDEEWVDTVDYRLDPARAQSFCASIRRYWPELAADALQPAYCGIRPKLSGPGDAARDFVIQRERDHGVPGLVNLFGIDSPGLTACLALADAAVQGR